MFILELLERYCSFRQFNAKKHKARKYTKTYQAVILTVVIFIKRPAASSRLSKISRRFLIQLLFVACLQ